MGLAGGIMAPLPIARSGPSTKSMATSHLVSCVFFWESLHVGHVCLELRGGPVKVILRCHDGLAEESLLQCDPRCVEEFMAALCVSSSISSPKRL